MLRPIRRALLSVSDKTGLVDFARELVTKYGVELIATGGTREGARRRRAAGEGHRRAHRFPEILDGRVKTLHPAIYAGLLAKRDKPEHMTTLAEHELPEIDLVVCNLYPFEQTVAKPGVTEAEAIENIDIGGPCMVRAAAKNFDAVAIVDRRRSSTRVILKQLEDERRINVARATGLGSRATAFCRIAAYDVAIARYFATGPARRSWPRGRRSTGASVDPSFDVKQTLRYGENPHQEAAFYVEPSTQPPLRRDRGAAARQGTQLQQHPRPRLGAEPRARVRRAGVRGRQAQQPLRRRRPPRSSPTPSTLAWDGDPLSAFGGILAFNRPVDADTAAALMDPKAKRFVECVIAPDYEPHALDALKKWKENVRLLKTGELIRLPAGAGLPPRRRRPPRADPRRRGRQAGRRGRCVTKRQADRGRVPRRCTSRGSCAST